MEKERERPKLSLGFIAFLQAAGLTAYCGFVGLIIANGNRLFGPVGLPLGPVLFLLLFVVSALISGLIVLGYPFLLFWEQKQTRSALKLIFYTTLWLIAFISFLIFFLFLFKF